MQQATASALSATENFIGDAVQAEPATQQPSQATPLTQSRTAHPAHWPPAAAALILRPPRQRVPPWLPPGSSVQ